jgi:hypothetical protein
MKQTSVEWLFDKLITEKHTISEWDNIVEQAKETEKQQRIDAVELFITEIKNEFKDDNWDYLEFIKVRVIEQFKKK